MEEVYSSTGKLSRSLQPVYEFHELPIGLYERLKSLKIASKNTITYMSLDLLSLSSSASRIPVGHEINSVKRKLSKAL